MKNFYLLIFAILLLQSGCGEKVAGTGSGTETSLIAGNFTDKNNKPAANTTVYIRPITYLPTDSATGTVDSTTTNKEGRFEINSALPGMYILEAKDDKGNGAFVDSILITDDVNHLNLDTIQLAPTGAVTGSILLPDTTDTSDVKIMLYGLSLLGHPDSSGTYNITGIPAGSHQSPDTPTGTMRLWNALHKPPDIPIEIQIEAGETTQLFTKSVNINAIESTLDTVRLTWSSCRDSLKFDAYLIYYDDSSIVNTSSTLDTTFTKITDTSRTISGLDSGVYFFKVYVRDREGNYWKSNTVSDTITTSMILPISTERGWVTFC